MCRYEVLRYYGAMPLHTYQKVSLQLPLLVWSSSACVVVGWGGCGGDADGVGQVAAGAGARQRPFCGRRTHRIPGRQGSRTKGQSSPLSCIWLTTQHYPTCDAVCQMIRGSDKLFGLEAFISSVIFDQVLVDIGAGIGYFSLAAAARGHRAIAFELSNNSLASFEASIVYNGFQNMITVHKVLRTRYSTVYGCR